MRHLNKKTIVFTLIFLAALTLGIFLWRQTQSANISNDGSLSARGASYLQKKSLEDTSALKNVDLTQGQKRVNERVYAGDCFSFVVPFDIRDVKEESDGECSVEVSTNNPRVRFVAFQRPGEFESYDTVEGVGFRRLKKDEYSETVKNISNKEFLIFTKTQSPIEYTAYHLRPDSYLILNMLTSGSDSYEKEFEKVLESMKSE